MCHDDFEKHFPDRRRYNGILLVANSRQNAETIFFVLTFGLVGFTGFRSLFFDRTFNNNNNNNINNNNNFIQVSRRIAVIKPLSKDTT